GRPGAVGRRGRGGAEARLLEGGGHGRPGLWLDPRLARKGRRPGDRAADRQDHRGPEPAAVPGSFSAPPRRDRHDHAEGWPPVLQPRGFSARLRAARNRVGRRGRQVPATGAAGGTAAGQGRGQPRRGARLRHRQGRVGAHSPAGKDVTRGFDLGCCGSIISRQISLRSSGRRQMSSHHTPEEIRKGLTHPVIDGDGHWVEYGPVFAEQIRKVTGDLGANGFLQSQRRGPDALSMTPQQRAEKGVATEGFWGRQSTNPRDRATAMMPRMLYARLGELGIDFGIVYPTAGLGIPRIADDATRRAVIRGFNVVTHEYFKDLGDKLTPAAVIGVHTPDEAIEEL